VIQLWGSSNYHYYLKQELRLPGNDHFSSFQWDPESPLMLHALSESGNYIRYDFESIVLIGTSLSPKNMGTVAVIDGCELHLTPFKTKNVPPPMSFSKVDFDCSLIHISFGFDSDSNDAAVLLSNQSVLFLENISGSTTSIRRSCTFQLPDTGIQLRQIAWVSKDKLIGLGYNFIDLKDQLIEYELLPDSINFRVIPLGEIEKNIFCLIHNVNCNVLAFETVDGVVYNSKKIVNIVTKSEEKWILELKAVFPSPCPKVSCARIGTINPEISWIGLNRRNKLYFGESTLALDCTSFAIHNECLIITTLEHVAKFLSLSLEVTGKTILI
jgi:elongator complex protein 1